VTDMSEKKKPGRFTLQFNLEDPQQQTVSELLEQQGRHKAQFLTSAVLYYIQQPEQHDGQSKVDEKAIEKMLFSIIKKHPQFSTAVPSERSKDTPSQPTTAANSWNTPMGDDAMMAISETLAAFQQE